MRQATGYVRPHHGTKDNLAPADPGHGQKLRVYISCNVLGASVSGALGKDMDRRHDPGEV